MTPSPTATTPATPVQSEASTVIGLLFELGVAAAGIFVKNPNHIGTASNIIGVLQALLPQLESIP